LSTFAVRRDIVIKFSGLLISLQLIISFGVFLAVLPFPPNTRIPYSGLFLKASFIAAVTVVVTPDECQSNPEIQPKI